MLFKQKFGNKNSSVFFGMAIALEYQFLNEIPIKNSLIIKLNSCLIIKSLEK